jgi:glycosyltransferase involved in cell wall biosynthesis
MTRPVAHLINLNETPANPPFSGAENHLWVLLPALAAAGVPVELIVLLQATGPAIEARLAELTAAGIGVHRVPYRRRVDPVAVARLRARLAERRPRILHTHMLPADLHGGLAARLVPGVAVVSTVHNDEPRYLRPGWCHLVRATAGLAAHHVAISERVRRYLVDGLGLAPGRVSVIHYGIPPPREIVGARARARAELGIAADAFAVGFVGRLVPQKNVDLLVAAMARLPEARCVIVGDGPLRAALAVQAARCPNVTLVGHRPHAEALMPGLDVLCLPSRWEGLGLVLVEAMLRGVPVVGSRAGAIPEVLGDGAYGVLFEPGDEEGLVAAIARARVDGPELAARALAHAREAFSVDRMVARTLAVYDGLERR